MTTTMPSTPIPLTLTNFVPVRAALQQRRDAVANSGDPIVVNSALKETTDEALDLTNIAEQRERELEFEHRGREMAAAIEERDAAEGCARATVKLTKAFVDEQTVDATGTSESTGAMVPKRKPGATADTPRTKGASQLSRAVMRRVQTDLRKNKKKFCKAQTYQAVKNTLKATGPAGAKEVKRLTESRGPRTSALKAIETEIRAQQAKDVGAYNDKRKSDPLLPPLAAHAFSKFVMEEVYARVTLLLVDKFFELEP